MRWSPAAPASLRAALGYRSVGDALGDLRGRRVRAVPRRTTFAMSLGEHTLYRKVRTRRPGDAEREWRRLGELAAAGFAVPARVFFARRGRDTALGTRAVPGRSLFELVEQAQVVDEGARRFLVESVAGAVRRLHAAGWVHRDLYWHHLFAERMTVADGAVHIIDVERVFRPRVRRRRWIVKDLAALLASWPLRRSEGSLGLRFLRGYLGGDLTPGWRRLARDVIRKAARMRRHVPRHDPRPGPGPPSGSFCGRKSDPRKPSSDAAQRRWRSFL